MSRNKIKKDLKPTPISVLKKVNQGEIKAVDALKRIFGFDMVRNLEDENVSEDELRIYFQEIYNKIIYPALVEELQRDLKKNYKEEEYGRIYKEFPSNITRERIVQFAEAIAKEGMVKEAISIVKIFVNDPDPFQPNTKNPEGSGEKFNYHKRILKGDSHPIIATVRGWCGWTLLQCSGPDGRPYIEDIINLTEKLLKDDNWLVVQFGALALSGLTKNRLAVRRDDKKRLFFGRNKKEALKRSKRVEELAFDLLEQMKKLKEESPKAMPVMAKPLAQVFQNIRALNYDDAKKLINDVDSLGDEAIKEFAPLFIYFAEFRSDHYKNWEWKDEELGLYNDLEEFRSDWFQEKLKRVMKESPDTRSAFAFRFRVLPKEDGVDYSKAFDIAIKYLNQLMDKYDRQTFTSLYIFIDENIEKRPEECYELWKKCIKEEIEYYKREREEKEIREVIGRDFYPYYGNTKILKKIYEELGFDSFVNGVNLLFSFPKKVPLGPFTDLLPVLKQRPPKEKQTKKIFDKIIEKGGQKEEMYREAKKEWENQG